MGNRLLIQDRKKEIKITRVDGGSGKVLIKMPPTSSGFKLKVHNALAEAPQPAPGHGSMVSGVLPAAAADPAGTAVRVKLVISKQELNSMLAQESVSLDDVASLMRRDASSSDRRRGEERVWCRGWRPALESIPEGSDLSS